MACQPNQESMSKVELKINGEKTELNTFVQNFVAQTVTGMVKSLRGVGDVETVDLRISKRSQNAER